MSKLDHGQYRQALGRFATGVAVVTATGQDELVGLTINSFASVSLDPPLVLWSLRADSPSAVAFRNATHFAINVLGTEQQDLSNRFARPGDKYMGIDWSAGLGGAPLLTNSLASFECSRHAEIDGGDHVIFLGRVERFAFREGQPLLYFSGGYRAIA